MIKRIGAFFRGIFFLAALGLVGYNTWELSRLRAEVATLRQQAAAQASKKHAPTPSQAEPVGKEPSAILSAPQWMGDAQKHAERAQAFLRNKQYAEAKTEMDQAIALARQNGQAAQKESRDAVQKLQKAADAVSHQAMSLWDKNHKEAGRSAKQP